MRIADVDILENDILDKYPGVLPILLSDHTTQSNILWATDNYKDHGEAYCFSSEILPELITGVNGNIIMPRVQKDAKTQNIRIRDMAEVYTPSWICNTQNNLIDSAWFGRENVFNTEIIDADGVKTWVDTIGKITFPDDKSWKHYIRDTRLEVACGEAPYLASRYDTTTGEFIPLERRIGLLDRKMRVINENIDDVGKWLEAAQIAYKNIYAFEWQGDSLLLAREALLFTFIENYKFKFDKEPLLKSIKYIAYIVSWNVWQMDGLKAVIPNSCKNKISESINLLGEKKKTVDTCNGCEQNNLFKHNGIYPLIRDWRNTDITTGKKGRKIKFVDLINKNII